MLAAHGRARGRLRLGLLVLSGGVVGAIVFRVPKTWGSGEVAEVVRGLAWFGMVVGGITAHIANGTYHEALGYFRGRFGDERARSLLASGSGRAGVSDG